MEGEQAAPRPTRPPGVVEEQRLIVLIGLPGCGKSHIASLLSAAGYARVSQDELGSRQRCLDAAASALRSGASPVVDRCNHDRVGRSHWVRLAARAGVAAVAVELTPPLQVCVARACARTDHPTLKPCEAEGVVRRFAAEFQAADESEGFTRVIRAATDEDAERAVGVLGAAGVLAVEVLLDQDLVSPNRCSVKNASTAAVASSRSAAMITPLPAARPSALSTTG